MTGCGIIALSNKNNWLWGIVMKIMSAVDHLLFRVKVCNKQIAWTVYITGQLALIGAFYG